MYRLRIKKKVWILMTLGLGSMVVALILMSQLCDESDVSPVTVPFVRKFPHRHWRNTERKMIIRWTGFFGDASWEDAHDDYFRRCKVSNCGFINNKLRLDEADAVLFHAGDTFNYWRGIDWPSRRHPYQVWILYNVEPPTRTPLNFRNLAGVFNWTAFYRLDSDVPVSYGGHVRYDIYINQNSSVSQRNFAREKPEPAGWMSSNCFDFGRRLRIINELQQYLLLDTYGKCGQRHCPETICKDVLTKYKFFFAIENSICTDYVSEKFWEALRRRQVPVVLGGADYSKIAPPNSYINIADFKNLKTLAEYLQKLGNDEQEYNKLLEWTYSYDVYGEIEARRMFWCDLCEALHDQNRSAQVYENIHGWFRKDVMTCPQWTNQISRWIDGLKLKWTLL